MNRHSRKPPPQTPATHNASGFQAVTIALVVALTIITPLTPTESHYENGTAAWLVLLWLVAAGLVAASSLLRRRYDTVETTHRRHGSPYPTSSSALFCAPPAVWLALALSAWVVVSGLVQGPQGNFRWVVNGLWQWVAYPVSFFVMLQLARQRVVQRGLLLVGLATAATAAVYGIYEWRWVHPEVVRQYERDPEGTLRRAGIVAEEGSPQRRQFEDRLNSTEPFATFGLPNSLAGFLATWLAVAGGLAVCAWRSGLHKKRWLLSLVGMIGLTLFCLVLTKSRTAWIAAIVAAGGIAVTGGAARGRPILRLLVPAAIGLGAIATVAVYWIDPLVIAQAPLSIRYRLEYWAASLRLLADHPWLGCGVGNFQSFYPQYMFPWSSETVADPHNFLVELLATAGVPAGLIAVMLLARVFRTTDGTSGVGDATPPVTASASTGANSTEESLGAAALWGLTAGAGLGWIALPCLVLSQGQVPDPVLLLLLGILLVLTLAAGIPFLRSPIPLPASVAWWSLAAWFVNALAAGAVGIWGVSHSMWLLMALLLARRPSASWVDTRAFQRWGPPVALAAASALALAAWRTEVQPTVALRRFAAQASATVDERDAERAWLAAASADPLSSVPWKQLAVIRLGRYLHEPREGSWKSFHDAVQQALQRERHSAPLFRQAGDWYLLAWQAPPGGRARAAKEMVECYRQAVRYHPGNAFYHAQLAWAYWLLGERSKAEREAERALAIDAQVPHEELRLVNRRLFEGMQRASVSAERRMEQIRSKSVE